MPTNITGYSTFVGRCERHIIMEMESFPTKEVKFSILKNLIINQGIYAAFLGIGSFNACITSTLGNRCSLKCFIRFWFSIATNLANFPKW